MAGLTLSVLSVAFPFAPVSADSVGGAEQVLSALDRALVEVGHRSIVIGCEGSQVAGELVPLPRHDRVIDEGAKVATWKQCRQAIEYVLRHRRVDLIHFHGVDYYRYMPAADAPAIVTLHLPIDWYPAEALKIGRPNTWFQGVAPGQVNGCCGPNVLAPIENGVPIPEPVARCRKRRFAVILGRICPEKGVHLAIEAAKLADMPLLIAGLTYPYSDHVRYFEDEIRPRLDRHRRFIGPVGAMRKRRLLTAARCLLVPSLVAETSSLVAREALACGTPVVGFARGALLRVIEHGRTGFLVDGIEAMAQAIAGCAGLSSSLCREVAAARFSDRRMIGEYLALYARLARLRIASA